MRENYKVQQPRRVPRFKRFTRKHYALFACLGKEVLIGVLSIATVAHAKAAGVSTRVEHAADTMQRQEVRLDEVVVTGTRAPLTAGQQAAMVRVVTREEIDRAAGESINDVLRTLGVVDVRQRGPLGLQTDISIGGGTFDRITILLDGVNISSPQTGHNSAFFFISPSDVERIEVLGGAAARLFGTSAFDGVVNIVTRRGDRRGAGLTVQGGQYGTFMANGHLSLPVTAGDAAHPLMRHRLSAGYSRSDGGTPHSDFHKRQAFYSGTLATPRIHLRWQAGGSRQDFGANTFYSARYDNQWEDTYHLHAALAGRIQVVPGRLDVSPVVYWNRYGDHYQLIRGSETGENRHRTEALGGSVSLEYSWTAGKTVAGADFRREHIFSTALGEPLSAPHGDYDHEAERICRGFYAEHDLILGPLTVSAGLSAYHWQGGERRWRLYPGVDASLSLSPRLRVFASWNTAQRQPTFTDLYTNSAVQQGDRLLRPERCNAYRAGARYSAKAVSVEAGGFLSRGRDMIDWVYMTETDSRYQAANISRLTNMGYSLAVAADFRHTMRNPIVTSLRMDYARIHQRSSMNQPVYRSLYALEYLRHKVSATLCHRIAGGIEATWTATWQQRMNGYTPYTKIDGALRWTRRAYTVFVKADNITAHRYYDVAGVRQPGLWLMGGATIKFF